MVIQRVFSRWISTHSLTRRLTSAGSGKNYTLEHFNSQPHKEADKDTKYILIILKNFNSQPHKEADTVFL